MADEIEVAVPETAAEDIAAEVETEVATPETPVEEEAHIDQVDWKAEAEKAKALANNQKIRAEKAEQRLKSTPPPQANGEAPMSLADAAALLKADVHEDDIERVEKFAKSEGVSVREALRNDELKAILAVRAEKRTTAQAANVSNVRRGPTKMADDVLISNAEKGRLPEDDEGISRLVAAKLKQK